MQSLAAWMAERGLDLPTLTDRAGLEPRIVKAIVEGRYTPSPGQRSRLAAALEIDAAQVGWGHVNPVENLYGHGPQFGRTP